MPGVVGIGARLSLKRGDQMNVTFLLEDQTLPSRAWVPADLTLASNAKLFVKDAISGSALISNGSLTLQDPANGLVRYHFTSAETATIGLYNGEIQVTFSNGDIRTYPPGGYIAIEIVQDLG